jgi:hypothetical protein
MRIGERHSRGEQLAESAVDESAVNVLLVGYLQTIQNVTCVFGEELGCDRNSQ